MLSWRLRGEGEASPRAVLPGQEVLKEAAFSEHKLAVYLLPGDDFRRIPGADPRRPEGWVQGKWDRFGWKFPYANVIDTEYRIAKTMALLELTCLSGNILQ